jgi:hypothetical protein
MFKQNNPVLVRNEQEEYSQVRKDLIFVVVLNVIFLVLLLGLFFFNRSTSGVDSFFAHLLKFQ